MEISGFIEDFGLNILYSLLSQITMREFDQPVHSEYEWFAFPLVILEVA
jgi:hypothetical protein